MIDGLMALIYPQQEKWRISSQAHTRQERMPEACANPITVRIPRAQQLRIAFLSSRRESEYPALHCLSRLLQCALLLPGSWGSFFGSGFEFGAIRDTECDLGGDDSSAGNPIRCLGRCHRQAMDGDTRCSPHGRRNDRFCFCSHGSVAFPATGSQSDPERHG